MTTPTNIDYYGIKLNSADDTQSTTLTMDGTTKGLKFNYDLTTTSKEFSISSAGANYTSGSTNYTTSLSRLAQVQTALQSVELPPNSSTLAINNTLQLNYTADNNILFDQASNDIVYPLPAPNTTTDFQTRITKNVSDNLELYQLGSVDFTKNKNSLVNTSYSSLGTTPLSPSNYSTIKATFESNNKIIIANTSLTYDKIIYVQNYANSSFTTVDLTPLTTGATNYAADLPLIYITQFIPVHYNSQTDCKFFIRLTTNSLNNRLYLITCNGDPTQLTSYSYSTYYLTHGNPAAPYLLSNGASWNPLPATSNGSIIFGQKAYLAYYDSINDVLVGYSNHSTSASFVFVVNPSLTGAATYNLIIQTSGSYTPATYPAIVQAHKASNILLYGYTNGVTNNASSLYLQLVYADPTSKSVTFSYVKETTELTNQSWSYDYQNWGTYSIQSGGLTHLYFMWLNNTNTSSRVASLARYTWDNLYSTPAFLSSSGIQNVGSTSLYSTTLYSMSVVYYSIRVYTKDHIEIFSSWTSGGTGNDGTFYITLDSFATSKNITISGICNGYTTFTHLEGNSLLPPAANLGVVTIYPQHTMCRGNGFDLINATVSDFQFLETEYPTSTKYLSLDYNLSTNKGTISSTKDTTISATPITLSSTGTMPLTSSTNISATVANTGGQIQLNGTDLQSATSSGSSGQHLKIIIGGVTYKIALLND